MKRFCILALAAVMLCAALTGCAGTGVLDDSYSNVSTTRDGTVNGTNGERGYNAERRYYGTNGYNGSTDHTDTRGSVGSSGYNDRNNTGNFYSGSANTDSYTGTESGTGMVGGE